MHQTVCKTMALWATCRGFGPSLFILLGSRDPSPKGVPQCRNSRVCRLSVQGLAGIAVGRRLLFGYLGSWSYLDLN